MLAAPSTAERLCRDLKGLFTPCPETLNKVAQRHLQAQIDAAPIEIAGKSEDPTAPAVHARPAVILAAKPSQPRKKLCRDLKGLYTACT